MSNHTSKAGTKGTFGFSMIAYAEQKEKSGRE
jgi:hypothetical protein